MRYIKGTLDYGIEFNASENEISLIGYSDADWGGGVVSRKSTFDLISSWLLQQLVGIRIYGIKLYSSKTI